MKDRSIQPESFKLDDIPEEALKEVKHTLEVIQKSPDMVNHPPHYTSHPSGIECIDITRHMGFNVGNAVKYLWRADLKWDSLEDLKKAAWYINDEIKKRESEKIKLDNESKI